MSEFFGGSGPYKGKPLVFRAMRAEADFRRLTRGIDRDEREKYDSFLWNMIRMDPAPKVAIRDVVGSAHDNVVGFEHESPLKSSLDHYYNRNDRGEMVRVLKFYCAYMMQQARKGVDQSHQIFAAFKAVDFARMIIQYSPYCVNSDAEALVFGIFYDLGEQIPAHFRRYLNYEQRIYDMMKRLQVAPLDDAVRMELADHFIKQSCAMDAVVQYHFMMSRMPKQPRDSDSRRGRIYVKLGEIFKELSEYASQAPEEIQDARKLKNFIERYNREFAVAGKHIVQLEGPSSNQLRKTAVSLRREAIRWLAGAAVVKTLNPRLVAQVVESLSELYLVEKRNKEALKLLADGYSSWNRVADSEESMKGRVDYLNRMIPLAMQLRNKKLAAWGNQELREAQNRLNELLSQQRAKEKRIAEIKGGGDDADMVH